MPGNGDERLVAIAVPAASILGNTANWPAYCRADGKLSPRYYPMDAAVGTATYQVWSVGVGGCESSAHKADLGAIELAPICGQ